jgi:S-adenosylmethionine:tRNA ribosyltransferase-isomerase
VTASVDGADPMRILDDYDFELPEDRIAQTPAPHREDARLLVLDRTSGCVLESGPEHRVRALPEWLRAGDLLVVNATRVMNARLRGRKATGGAAEALLLGPAPAPGVFRALLKCGGRLRVGLEFAFGDTKPLAARIDALHERGEVSLRFEPGADPYAQGIAPLPPYIKRGLDSSEDSRADLERYQTVYAREPGAVAAPTAGLHLSHALLQTLQANGVEIAEIVLHVGAGTFRPLDREALESGRLHVERFELPEATAAAIARARVRGGRVVAVGTTTTRVLESRASGGDHTRDTQNTQDAQNPQDVQDAAQEARHADANVTGVVAGAGETDLFMRPGGPPFRVVDGMLTNFHLPRSSLLLLVAAFVGRGPLLEAYRQAISSGFRFYSYGDAMLILPQAERRARG